MAPPAWPAQRRQEGKAGQGVGELTDLSPRQPPTSTRAGPPGGGGAGGEGDRKPEQTPLPAVSSGILMAAGREAPGLTRPQALGIEAPGGTEEVGSSGGAGKGSPHQTQVLLREPPGGPAQTHLGPSQAKAHHGATHPFPTLVARGPPSLGKAQLTPQGHRGLVAHPGQGVSLKSLSQVTHTRQRPRALPWVATETPPEDPEPLLQRLGQRRAGQGKARSARCSDKLGRLARAALLLSQTRGPPGSPQCPQARAPEGLLAHFQEF